MQQGQNKFWAAVVFDCPSYWTEPEVKEFLGRICTPGEKATIYVTKVNEDEAPPK
jgi:hypothetical protein